MATYYVSRQPMSLTRLKWGLEASSHAKVCGGLPMSWCGPPKSADARAADRDLLWPKMG